MVVLVPEPAMRVPADNIVLRGVVMGAGGVVGRGLGGERRVGVGIAGAMEMEMGGWRECCVVDGYGTVLMRMRNARCVPINERDAIFVHRAQSPSDG